MFTPVQKRLSAVILFCCSAATLAFCAVDAAHTPLPQPVFNTGSYTKIKGIKIEGLRQLSWQQADVAMAEFIQQPLTPATLHKMLSALKNVYTAAGFAEPYVQISLAHIHTGYVDIQLDDGAAVFQNETYRFGYFTAANTHKKSFAFNGDEQPSYIQINHIQTLQQKNVRPAVVGVLDKKNVSLAELHKTMYNVQQAYAEKRLYPPKIEVKLDDRTENNFVLRLKEYKKI